MSTKKEESSKSFMAEGKRIAELREKSGLSQQEFADRIGVSQRQVSAYEMGKDRPRRSTRLNICREFLVREEWLEHGKLPREQAPQDGSKIDPTRPYAHLSPEQKKQLAREMLEEIFQTRGVEKVWDHLVHQLVVLLAVDPAKLDSFDIEDMLRQAKKSDKKK